MTGNRRKAQLCIKVLPGARANAVVGRLGDCLKLRVAAPANKGKANTAAAALLASHLGVPVADVTIVAGHGAPRKRVAIAGLDDNALQKRLGRPTS